MGRGGRGKKFRGNRGGGGRGPPRGGEYRSNRQDVPKHNESYVQYYDELGIAGEEERGHFWNTMRRELPNSFRFTGSRAHALAVQQRLRDYYIPEITAIKFEGEFVEPPKPVSWYPDKLAWSMTTPKGVIRKFPPFASFQKFLVSETEVGNISRQEIVSMIPPLVMGIKPGMTVLDICAAPGSKTAQMIEMLHAGEEESMRNARELQATDGNLGHLKAGEGGFDHDDGRSIGLLIANDVDYKRAHLLIHQTKRLNSPNLLVTNHDATMYPSIKLPSDQFTDGKWHPNRYLKFDRILADVPCSGDGTSRKNAEIWTKWTPGNALGLYVVQCRILVRSLQMLKVGGRVIYSTCSMNPVENEAVVASAIERCGGSAKVQLIDCSNQLPGLIRKSGFTDWPVMDKTGRIWESWEETKEQRQQHGENVLGRLVETMFAPPKSDSSPQLQHCMRIYPHLQDTGGFFIAVLEKKSEIRARPEGEPKMPEHEHMGILKAIDQLTDPAYEGKRIDALDEAPQAEPEPETNPSAAERLDEPYLSDSSSTSKRKRAEEEAKERKSYKRLKHTEPPKHFPPLKQPHYHRHNPPPPGAMLGHVEHRPEHNPSVPVVQSSLPPKKKRDAPFEEPFKYLPPTHPELEAIFDFYRISPRFPRNRFMVRNASGNPAKTIYYTSTLARDILTGNEGKGMKFVHCGVKMFVKQDVQNQDTCPWRIQTDGLPIVESWVGEERVVYLSKRETLRKLLVEMFPKVTAGAWKDLGEIGERVRDIPMGCCVLRVELAEGKEGLGETMVLPLWRSLHSLNLMLPKEERRAMLLRLFNDSTPLQHLTRADADKVKDKIGDEGNTSSAGSPDAKENMGDAVNSASHAEEETKVENENPVDQIDDKMEEEKQSKGDLESAAMELDGEGEENAELRDETTKEVSSHSMYEDEKFGIHATVSSNPI